MWDRTGLRGWVDEPWFLGYLDTLGLNKAIVVIVRQDSCTRRIFAYSQPPQRDIRSAGGTWVGTVAVSWILSALVVFTSVVFVSVMFASTFALASLSLSSASWYVMVLHRHVAITVIANKTQCQDSD